jgi:serine phosphatase RsbU (regulator of sigma subunit)
VNDQPVHERALASGDRISIGDYTLRFSLDKDGAAPDSIDLPPYDDDKPTVMRRLGELEAPRIAAGHLRTLLEFSRRLVDLDDTDERLEALCQLLVGAEFSATLAVVIQVKGARWSMLSRPLRPGNQLAPGRPYVSRRVLDMMRDTKEPVLATNMAMMPFAGPGAVEISMARDLMELWVIACPFRFQGDTMDVLYTNIPRDCGSAEWLNLYALAAEVYQQGEVASAHRRKAQEHAAIERELDTARQIQRGLLPRQLGAPGLDVAVGFEPCKYVGGDYVDVVHLPDGRVLFTVGDVCGKGLQAALVSSSLHTIVRAAADTNPPLADLMERVNRHLCEWLPAHSFVTMVAAVVDPRTGQLECVNAGHPPVIVVDRRGALRLLQEAENPALGMVPVTMATQLSRLEPGEVLAMYTDGLTELRNDVKDMLGQEQLGKHLGRICVERRAQGAEAMREGLMDALDTFRGDEPPEDDRTFLLARRT